MTKAQLRRLAYSILLFIVAILGAALAQPVSEQPGDNGVSDKAFFAVSRVVDGDTFRIQTSDGEETVRLIGVNTPETVDPRREVECYGKEASAELKNLIEGKEVYIQFDTTQGERDKYGRLLVYAWVNDEDPTVSAQRFINLELIRGGFAYEYTYNTPYKYQAQFKAAQLEAQSLQLGLWGSCAVQ
ncbi:MAG: thermonuclease family protein [Candidatus Doudnabacteria bacterium]|nr:thermonuclease family protein [Candidatus Doudnabacteria bacterium]